MSTINLELEIDGTVTSVTVDGVPYVAAAAAPTDEVIKDTTAAPVPVGGEAPAGGEPAPTETQT